jgi:uncharacterized membrane protein YgcG
MSQSPRSIIALMLGSAALLHCSSADTSELGQQSSNVSVDKDQHSKYGITVFGKGADEQPLACGGDSGSESFYAASSQRYGCGTHLKLVASNGKCAVVSTQDVGPAAWVEDNAGMPVMDVDPAVAEHLFGTSSIGWQTLANTGDKFTVSTSVTTMAVGPCGDEASSSGGSSSGGSSSGGSSSGGSSSGGSSSGGDSDDGSTDDGSSDEEE